MKQVTVYYSPFCPFCIMAFILLGRHGIKNPTRIRVDNDSESMREMISRTRRHTMPQIYIGDLHVGGCDELHALDREGRLERLLDNHEKGEGEKP